MRNPVGNANGPSRRGAIVMALALCGSLALGVSGAGASQLETPEVTTGHASNVGASGATLAIGGPFAFQPGAAGFDASTTNQEGSPDAQAGSHPYEFTTSLNFTNHPIAGGGNVPDGDLRDLRVDLPAGMVVNPEAAGKCTEAQLEANEGTQEQCPPSSIVGTLTFGIDPLRTGHPGTLTVQLFNMVPPGGVPADFGFQVAGVFVHLIGGVRTGGDYGLFTMSDDILAKGAIYGVTTTLWGVPADPSHDDQRCNVGISGNAQGTCTGPPGAPDGPTPAGVPPQAFVTLPASCTGPLTTTISADSWQNPGQFVTDTSVSHDEQGTPIGLHGCSTLDFSPTLTAQPDTTVADSPSGLSVDLHMPQDGLADPAGLAEANLKDTTVTLPAGVTVSPSSADGLRACTPDEIGMDNANNPSCPAASKIGSVEVDSPLLPDPLEGGVYVAQPSQNPFGSLLAIYVTAEADGTVIKLAGHVVPDPITGQLTTTFSNNPQLPFTDFKLDVSGGPRAALATPESCGSYSTQSVMTPWSGTPAVGSSDPFQITSGCVSGFSPSFTAGMANPQAGAHSSFGLSFERSDTDQELSGLSVTLPPGMLAKLAGVQECSEAELAAAAATSGAAEQANPSCPAGSRVGTVTTGAGPGPNPFFLGGSAYLTGPYKGAPYGLATVVPAVAGPYDLGTVVVRQALYLDPTTAQVTAVSDPFPTILQGIPIRLREVDVTLDRRDFTVNPTSCNPMSIGGLLSSTGGLTAPVSSRFQVGGCESLGFSPHLKIALTGKGKTRSGDHPTLTATLTQPGGQANIQSAKVALPLSLALDPNNSQHVCNYDVAQAVHGGAVACPASTIVGHAAAVTPLLSQPLSGNVYLVQGIRFGRNGQRIHTLPTLLIPLRGQIALDLRASSSVNGAQQLVTTFSTIPDAPVSTFSLQIDGGPKGILVITGRGRTICGAAQVASAQFGAQAGKADSASVTLSKPCTAAKRTARRRRHARQHSSLRRAR